ncbi:DUF3820 family protein [Granulosicoccus sp. 3-233]|uniref:DUF3820 family protein n=1 Tax=Granulosicoccus sp. 3-233 TaxID=3417969 RepID=UPI003D34B2D6
MTEREDPLSGDLSAEVLDAAAMPMPFGRFKGTRLIDLPEPYVVWFKGQGFPAGLLGQRLALMYEIKANGLEKLIRPLLESHDTLDRKDLQD